MAWVKWCREYDSPVDAPKTLGGSTPGCQVGVIAMAVVQFAESDLMSPGSLVKMLGSLVRAA